ncbi:MAG: dTMP kinase [Gammaproteobacteria bacterium]|nr:dTMP kinase [Gammaproteobacteria bacterium]|tara:strand:+ start:25631 stop:26287 length:657 start_codon:yes stop_codon:yes gene_type:complete
MQTGRLIAVCGIDGCGKSTLAEALVRALNSDGVPAKVVRTLSSDSAFFEAYTRLLEHGSKVDLSVLSALLAFERVRNTVEWIEPALTDGVTCVCDRYLWTEQAYSSARGVETAAGHWDQFCSIVPIPDLTILVDVPGDLAMKRIHQRGGAIYEFQENRDLLNRVREEYLVLQAGGSWGCSMLIDGREPVECCLSLALASVRALFPEEDWHAPGIQELR